MLHACSFSLSSLSAVEFAIPCLGKWQRLTAPCDWPEPWDDSTVHRYQPLPRPRSRALGVTSLHLATSDQALDWTLALFGALSSVLDFLDPRGGCHSPRVSSEQRTLGIQAPARWHQGGCSTSFWAWAVIAQSSDSLLLACWLAGFLHPINGFPSLPSGPRRRLLARDPKPTLLIRVSFMSAVPLHTATATHRPRELHPRGRSWRVALSHRYSDYRDTSASAEQSS